MRDGTAEPLSRDRILRRERGLGKIGFPCSAEHEQDWQPCWVDAYSATCEDQTYIMQHVGSDSAAFAFPLISVRFDRPISMVVVRSSWRVLPIINQLIRSGDGRWAERRGVGRLNPRRETK